MTAKKNAASAPELPELTDAAVEELMGPPPEKAPPASKVKPTSIYPEPIKEAGADASIKSAAEEANEALRSMDPNLGKAKIEKVEDEAELTEQESDSVPADDDTPADESEVPPGATDNIVPDTEQESTFSDDDSAEPLSDDVVDAIKDDEADDPLTSHAVDEIVAAEGDAVLAAEDAKKVDDDSVTVPLKKRQKARNWLVRLWGNKVARWSIIGGLAAIILAIACIPNSRYFVLNTSGVRASLNLTVLDNGTDQPLKNVQVSAAGVSGQTDSNGHIRLDNVRLGKTKLLIEKRAFADLSKDITVGWGSNPLGKFDVKAVGTQYIFSAVDFLSGKPMANAEASSGEGNAHADKEGKIVLTLDTSHKSDADQITVTVSSDSYRDETVNLTVNNKEEQSVKMVPSRKHVFVSKRSGKFDVYTVDVDGKNEKKIVAGTGLERDDIVLVPHQSGDIAAFVATRENVRDSTGYLLSTLYVLNTNTGDLVKIDQSEQIQVVGWSSDQHLVYVKIAAGTSGANPKRHRLMSFNAKNVADVKELASSNSFNDVLMMGDQVYYAPSNTFQDNPNASLFVVNPDGSNQRAVLNKEVLNIFRSDYNTLLLSTGKDWFSYTVGNVAATTATSVSSPTNRLYADNLGNTRSLWVDERDGKGVLLSFDKTKKTDTTLVTRAGLKTPVYWLAQNYVIYRVNDGKETADYVVNTDGGDPRKIEDVTDSSGIDRWYYY